MTVKQRLFVISDIHLDYKENREALSMLGATEHRHDSLIIAGDATDNMELLANFFKDIAAKFANVLFVPGNHELWIKRSEQDCSIEKFESILSLCQQLGIRTQPFAIGSSQRVWLVPLFSWYHTGEHGDVSLYMEKKGVEDKTFDMWSDFFVTRWPDHITDNVCDHFLGLNEPVVNQEYDAPVISVSHFLPRQELMLSTEQERVGSKLNYKDLHPEFNFSHVAGSKGIEKQIRELGSHMHVYGHQHRNRLREMEGVTYLSHCMGYPKERRLGVVAPECARPLEVWNDQDGFVVSAE